jgi:hypothetical protein
MRFIVKPNKFRKTPVLLKRTIGARKLVSYPGRYQPPLDYNQDLFLALPSPNRYPSPIINLPPSYNLISSFYHSNKKTQRSILADTGLKTPEAYPSDTYVVRPLQHFGGHGYRLTESSTDYNPASEYIAPAFKKWREYRVVFVKGVPIIILRKKPGVDASPYEPWNHTTGSFFQTVLDTQSCKLQSSRFFSDVSTNSLIKPTHLVGVDVLLDKDLNYAITEINFAPALTIESNLEVIRNVLNPGN